MQTLSTDEQKKILSDYQHLPRKKRREVQRIMIKARARMQDRRDVSSYNMRPYYDNCIEGLSYAISYTRKP